MSATPGTNPRYMDMPVWVSIIDPATGLPVTNLGGGGGGGSTTPAQVFAQQDNVSVGTASTQIAPASTTARQVTVTHPGGTNVVFVSYGRAAVLNSGQPIYPGGTWTSDPCLGAVFGITSSGTEVVTPFY